MEERTETWCKKEAVCVLMNGLGACKYHRQDGLGRIRGGGIYKEYPQETKVEPTKKEVLLDDYGQEAIDVLENAIVLPKQTYETLLAVKGYKPYLLISIYSLYYWTAKWQKTNQPYCTAYYTAQKLGIDRKTVSKYNKVLMSLGLIEMVQPRSKRGTMDKTYIKVKYVVKKNTMARVLADVLLPIG